MSAVESYVTDGDYTTGHQILQFGHSAHAWIIYTTGNQRTGHE